MAILSGAPRAASVESTADDTQLLEISGAILADLSQRYPQVSDALKKFCRQRLLSNVLHQSPLFKPFNKSDRRELVERFRARDVNKGTVLIREGERSDGMYILLSGEVEVLLGEQRLATLKEGEVFGEMSLLQKSPATATVAATRRTSLLRLPREDFDRLISTHPQILAMISELTDDRRRQTESVMGGVAVVDEQGLMLV
jgi:CRP-like cAMP-binding protein